MPKSVKHVEAWYVPKPYTFTEDIDTRGGSAGVQEG
jgi:hypothetical protein